MNYGTWAPMGWKCPDCGHVYSPTVTECYRCQMKIEVAGCPVCKGDGETLRFVRAPDCDKRIWAGDDFAGWAWLDQETRQIVYGAVGHDRNESSNA